MIGEIPNLLKELQGAKSGRPDATARLVKSAVRLFAPEYSPMVEGVGKLASRLGVQVTPEGLDITKLQRILAGESTAAALAHGESPWKDFAGRLRKLKSGAVLILGPRGEGKTQLAVRLAETWRGEHGYPVLGINMYPVDRKPWITWRSIKLFVDGMEELSSKLDEGLDPPQEIQRRVIIIDEASLSLHPQGEHTASLAVQRAIRQARHINWLVIVVAHLTKDLPVAMNWMDALLVKRPTGREVRADREDAQEMWERAAAAYEELERFGLQGRPTQGWVYADAAQLGYEGMVPCDLAGDEDPWQHGRAQQPTGTEAAE